MYTPTDRAIPLLLEQLDAVNAEYRRRIRVEDAPFTPQALAAEAERNPHKVRAFLQSLTDTQNLEMLVMVWRILQGLSIRHVEMTYDELEAFSLYVRLAPPGRLQDELEEYRSQNIMDVRLVRNFGVGTVTEKLPLQLPGFSLPRERRPRPAVASHS